MSFIQELQRRNVIRVAVLYVVGSWLILQVGDLLFDLMGLPDFALRIVLGILVLGFPAALVLSWIYEMTPGGLKRDEGTARDAPTRGGETNRLNLAVIVTVLLAVGLLLLDRFDVIGSGDRTSTPADPSAETTAAQDTAGTSPAEPDQGTVEDDASIAVLPFLNLSADAEQEFFSDGLADTLLHRLAHVPDLRVAARTSSFKFKGQNEDVREIARQLGVATVLEGSVQRQGDRIRITAQLIDGSDGSHLWSQVFDDTLDDIFRVQDEISAAVTSALSTTLLAPTDSTVGSTQNVAAYEAYLRGLDALDESTPEGANEAIAQLELATELDPAFALAWAALANAHLATARVGTVPWELTTEPAMRAAERAAALAPNRVETQLALANSLEGPENWDRWDAAVQRAYELNPNDARAIRAMAVLETSRDNHLDAFRLLQRAVLLDPLDVDLRVRMAEARIRIGDVEDGLRELGDLAREHPDNLDVQIRNAGTHYATGRMAEGVLFLLDAVDRRPDFLRGHLFLAGGFTDIGDVEAARHHLERAEAISPDRSIDDRADFCYDIGDFECFREAQQRYADYQRAAGHETRADIEETLLQITQGEYALVIERLGPLVELEDGIETDQFGSALRLAWAYGETGEPGRRDRILQALEDDIAREAESVTSQEALDRPRLMLDLVRGDLDSGLVRLERMSENRYFIPSAALRHWMIYQDLRAHPDFAPILEKQQAREAAWRASVAERRN